MPDAPRRNADDVQLQADPLRKLARARAEQAWEKSKDAVRLAKRHQKWELVVGVPGVIATAAGGASLLVDVPLAASILALIGGIATGLSGFLGSRALAQHHWNRHAGFEKIAQK